jgi:outer membrane receptor protein involved in Fe transport
MKRDLPFKLFFVSSALTMVALPVVADENPQTLSEQEQQVEVITVTGGFYQQNLQKMANSISVLSSEDITVRQAQNFEELAAMIPNINFSSGSQRARYYQIRGIGERSQFQTPINPSVGVVFDDIDFSGMGGALSTFDIAQTEVYRGPQGTRYGANAMAGLIFVSSKQPTEDFEANVKVSAGNYNTHGIAAVVSGPATEHVTYRLVAEQYKSDGFIHNDFLNRDDTNNRDETTLRAKVHVAVSTKLSFDFANYFIDFDNGYDAFSLDNNRTTLSDNPGFDRQQTRAFSGKMRYSALDIGEVTAILTHANTDLAYGYDEDWSFDGMHPWGYASTDHYFRDRNITTAEIRLQSHQAKSGAIEDYRWVVGAYVKQDDTDLLRQYTYLDQDFSSKFDTNTQAVYGQFIQQLLPELSLTAGLRFEQRSADYRNSEPLVVSPDDTMLGGKLELAYNLADHLLYATVSRGYKAGGANITGTLAAEYRTFDPEYLWNYEVGYKTNFWEDKAFLRSAIFYMDRTDVQVSSSLTLKRDDGSEEFIPYISNASSGWNKGIEIEAGAQLTSALSVFASLGLLDSHYDAFVDANGTIRPARQQAHAPNYQAYLSAQYAVDENWSVMVAAQAKDGFYFSDSHDQRSGAFALVDASVNYRNNQWQISGYVRNLFNRDVATRGFYFGNDPRDGYTAKTYTQLGEPRVVGLSVNYQF